MTVRFPAPLVPGDTIAITAPSTGVPLKLHPRLDLVIKILEKRGYKVIKGDCLRSDYKNQSACKQMRARELSAFLNDPTIKAVMPPWGGDLAIEIVEFIDFDVLTGIPPKWFVGFSDLSTLHLPLTTLSGWATLHGPNLMDLGAKSPDVTTEAIWRVLESKRGTHVEQQSSVAFEQNKNDWVATSDAGFNLAQPTMWKRLDGNSDAISFQGRLIGGCLDTLCRLAGTRFGPLPQFCAQNKNDGVILYFENVEMNPCELTRALYSLRFHGWFDHIAGILIGRSAGPEAINVNQHNYLDALRTSLKHLQVPIIYDVDIGHIPPQLSLVNGAMAVVTFAGNGGTLLQQL